MGKLKVKDGRLSKSEDLKAILARRGDSFEPVLEINQWGNARYRTTSITDNEEIGDYALKGASEQGQYHAHTSLTKLSVPRTVWPDNPYNFPDISEVLGPNPVPEYESDIPIDLPLWGYFSQAMDQSVLNVQDAIMAGYYSSRPWCKEEQLFRVDKHPKLDITAFNSTAHDNDPGSDEVKWVQQPQSTEHTSGIELLRDGTTQDNNDALTVSKERAASHIIHGEATARDEDSSVLWSFPRLAKDAEFTFEPAQTPECKDEIPSWSKSMYHSSVFLDPPKTKQTTKKQSSSDDPWVDYRSQASYPLEFSTHGFVSKQAVVDDDASISSRDINGPEEGGKTGSRPRRTSFLSELINLEEWKLSHILNDKGIRPRSGSDLAARFRRRTKSVYDDEARQWKLVPRTPSPPAQRPTAWQRVPASSYVYRVAGLRFPKVLADQVELSEDRKDIIRDGRQAAKEAQQAREQRLRDEQRRIAWQEAEEIRQKERLERQLKELDQRLSSLRYLFREEGDEVVEDDEQAEEEEDPWGWSLDSGDSEGRDLGWDAVPSDSWWGGCTTIGEMKEKTWGDQQVEDPEADDSWKSLPWSHGDDEEENQAEGGGALGDPDALIEMKGESEKAEEQGENGLWVGDSHGPDKFEESNGVSSDWGDWTAEEEWGRPKEKDKKKHRFSSWFSEELTEARRKAIREKIKEAEENGTLGISLAGGKRKRSDA
ncbi:hypothetical protein V8F20_006831 [Naviculisporaceae sp. PSN 640]